MIGKYQVFLLKFITTKLEQISFLIFYFYKLTVKGKVKEKIIS